MGIATARKLRSAGQHTEAKALLIELARLSPSDAEVQFEAACVHDYLGEEASAVPYYLAALAGTLFPRSTCAAHFSASAAPTELSGASPKRRLPCGKRSLVFPMRTRSRSFLLWSGTT